MWRRIKYLYELEKIENAQEVRVAHNAQKQHDIGGCGMCIEGLSFLKPFGPGFPIEVWEEQ